MSTKSTKKTPTKKPKKQISSKPLEKTWREKLTRPAKAATARTRDFLSRRPHRSFRRTYRRDYVRSLKMPGYWAFTNDVRKILWQQKKPFLWLVVIYAILTILLVGMAAQGTYSDLSDLLHSTSGNIFSGNWGAVGQASLLLVTGITGSFNASMTQAQQMYAVIIGLFTWLTTVWLLRAALANRHAKLRDALYNAGAPILPTFLVALVLVVQLIPMIAAVIGFVALTPYGIWDGGAESMLYWMAALLLTSVSFYWITSTFIALVVVTLPGMYPLKALRAAGDLVIGRRVRILLRMLWLLFLIVALWAVIMVPIILLDTWVKQVLPAIEWLPVIPVALLAMGTLTIVWTASYVYLLYRRIVDDDAAPA